MSGSVISRFRALMLLLAFGLGLAGQIVSSAAMAAQMQAAAHPGTATGMNCPACPGDQGGGIAASCTIAVCWTIPALPAQGGAAERPPQAVFVRSVELTVAGIATAPDPYPPRSFPHA